MKIEHIEVSGWRRAIRGMRNPRNSWDKSDSTFGEQGQLIELGHADLDRACKLIRAGKSDRKFLRLIDFSADFVIPRYVWPEFDTYRIGTDKVSCSTTYNFRAMTEFAQADFEVPIRPVILAEVNKLLSAYQQSPRGTQACRLALRELKANMPEGYLLRATVRMSYEAALSMLLDREHHLFVEWNLRDTGSICQLLFVLPFMSEFYAAAKSRRLADVPVDE